MSYKGSKESLKMNLTLVDLYTKEVDDFFNKKLEKGQSDILFVEDKFVIVKEVGESVGEGVVEFSMSHIDKKQGVVEVENCVYPTTLSTKELTNVIKLQQANRKLFQRNNNIYVFNEEHMRLLIKFNLFVENDNERSELDSEEMVEKILGQPIHKNYPETKNSYFGYIVKVFDGKDLAKDWEKLQSYVDKIPQEESNQYSENINRYDLEFEEENRYFVYYICSKIPKFFFQNMSPETQGFDYVDDERLVLLDEYYNRGDISAFFWDDVDISNYKEQGTDKMYSFKRLCQDIAINGNALIRAKDLKTIELKNKLKNELEEKKSRDKSKMRKLVIDKAKKGDAVNFNGIQIEDNKITYQDLEVSVNSLNLDWADEAPEHQKSVSMYVGGQYEDILLNKKSLIKYARMHCAIKYSDSNEVDFQSLFEEYVDKLLVFFGRGSFSFLKSASVNLSVGDIGLDVVFEMTPSDSQYTWRSQYRLKKASVNGQKINKGEVLTVIKRATCFTTQDNYDGFLTQVKKCSLRLHNHINKGVTILYSPEMQGIGAVLLGEDYDENSSVSLRMNIERIKNKTYLYYKDKDGNKVQHKLANTNSLLAAAERGWSTYDNESFLSLMKKVLSDFSTDKVIEIIRQSSKEHINAIKKSKQLLKESVEDLGLKEKTESVGDGWVVKGKMATYFLTKNGKVYKYPGLSYVCIVERGGIQRVGADKIVNRMYALSNDSVFAKDISTL